MNNIITIGNGNFEISRIYCSDKKPVQIVKEKIIDEAKLYNTILTSNADKVYNN